MTKTLKVFNDKKAHKITTALVHTHDNREFFLRKILSYADGSDIWKYVAFTLIGSITTMVVVGLMMLMKSL